MPEPLILERNPAHDEISASVGRTAIEGIVSYLDSPLQIVERSADKPLVTSLPKDSQIAARLRDQLIEDVDAISELPENKDGLNLSRVESYKRRMGGAKKKLLFFDEANYEAAESIYHNGEEKVDHYGGGEFFGLLDVAIVKRMRKEEKV